MSSTMISLLPKSYRKLPNSGRRAARVLFDAGRFFRVFDWLLSGEIMGKFAAHNYFMGK